MGENDAPLQLGDISSEKYRTPVTDPTVCHWCREPFRPPKRKRFVIVDECNHSGGWGIVSICFECWKWGYDNECESTGIRLDRIQRDCRGCGEPISTPNPHWKFKGAWRRFAWQVCSDRCYQRAYRKRRRSNGGGSAIDWKSGRWRYCKVCKKRLPSELRADARFCSNKCRQWHYRRSHQGTAP
jgi:predicted nucleic acid-binding Zn ribbon protein